MACGEHTHRTVDTPPREQGVLHIYVVVASEGAGALFTYISSASRTRSHVRKHVVVKRYTRARALQPPPRGGSEKGACVSVCATIATLYYYYYGVFWFLWSGAAGGR